jgi:hypothetical protein
MRTTLARGCTTYRWCTVTGPHETHHSADITVQQLTSATLVAGILAEDGSAPFIGFCETDLSPDALRAEVARLRALLPRLEALADIADADRTAGGETR